MAVGFGESLVSENIFNVQGLENKVANILSQAVPRHISGGSIPHSWIMDHGSSVEAVLEGGRCPTCSQFRSFGSVLAAAR